jgi:uncharacterized protein involved in outer membrane biogenesis
MSRGKVSRPVVAIGIVGAMLVLAVVLFQWDWLIPVVESRASAALGRPVTLSHLHVHLGRVTRVVADDVAIADPAGFPDGSKFATADHLTIDADVMAYIRDRVIKLPRIELAHPVVEVATDKSGQPNYAFPALSGGGSSSDSKPAQIGDLRIDDGHAHVDIPKLRADFGMDVSTREEPGRDAQLVVDAKGTYAGQPVTGKVIGGALLSLRDATHSYPVDLHAANGQTRISLVGTVQNPLNFAGADLKLDFAGPDMAQLLPLTGVPFPETPPFHVTGNLDYVDKRIRFTKFAGVVGKSDLNGDISVDPGNQRPDVVMDLVSHRVDLNDLGGLIGATPGDRDTKGQSATQQREHAHDAASSKLLPDTPINLPKLNAADIHAKYRGERIEGRSVPFDSIAFDIDVVDGAVRVHPASLAVGKGSIAANIALDPKEQGVRAKGDVDFRRLDVSRLMAPTGFQGAGLIGGKAEFDGAGRSVAQLLGEGNGDVKLFMQGGDLSAILVSLSGLQFGNALANALGVPSKTQMRCMVIDLPLQHGVLSTRTMLIDTDQSNINGSGTVNLKTEVLDYQLKTTPKHFSIGSLPAPIDIRGELKDPSILPDPATVAARGGAAVALGVLLTPLGALIPTIQLGLGEDSDCAKLISQTAAEGRNPVTASQIKSRTGR